MKKLWLTVPTLVVLLALTNPSRDRHERRIQDLVQERSPVAGLLGGGWLASKAMEYRSYGVASVGTLGGERVTVGVLGMVLPVREL